MAKKRETLSTRITEGLRDRLVDASKTSGRSLSQEIELRLLQTFWWDDLKPGSALIKKVNI